MNPSIKIPLDYNVLRKAFANEIAKVTGLTAILEEPETTNSPRPTKPYMSFKISRPGDKSGDDSKQQIFDMTTSPPTPTSVWNSGGVRKMTVEFNSYGRSHEEAYNYMALWQGSLDLSNIQADLRTVGIGVWIIGNVADLSQLMNTGYEGRAHMECTFGIAFNISSDLSYIETVVAEGTVQTDSGANSISVTETD